MTQEARMYMIRDGRELLGDERVYADPVDDTPSRWLRLVQFALSQHAFAAVTVPARWARYVADAHRSHGYETRVSTSASPDMRLVCVWTSARRAAASAERSA